MTAPPIWKWKPNIYWYRSNGIGWQLLFYQHSDHNPVIVISRWQRKWTVEFWRDYFFERALRKKYGPNA